MTRRHVRTLVIATALGFLTNVLVTAWCVYGAAIRPTHTPIVWDRGDVAFNIVNLGGPAKEISEWKARDPMSELTRQTILAVDGYDPALVRPVEWSTIHSAYWTRTVIAGRGRNATRVDIAYGWPCLSFRGGWYDEGGSPRMLDYGPALPELVTTVMDPNGTTTHREPRVVPLMPLFPGVLANTALYGAGWWALLLAPGAIRRRNRRRRGACVACGYDRRGIGEDTPCPECGTVVSGKPSAAPPARAGGSVPEAP